MTTNEDRRQDVEDHRICCGSFKRGSVTCPRGALRKAEADAEAVREDRRVAAYAYLGDHLDDFTWGDKIPANGA
jgi:hypothetical protein